jgi:UDP-GlcNAc:undecaprenyl-phosphate GlcNAc-1-phosphate transferase
MAPVENGETIRYALRHTPTANFVVLMTGKLQILCFCGSFVVAWLGIALTIRRARKAGAGDRPKCFHQTHEVAVPRLGGFGIAGAFVLTTSLAALLNPNLVDNSAFILLVLGPMLMFVVGGVDDVHPLGAKLKLLLQIGISILAVDYGGLAIEKITNPFHGEPIVLGQLGFVVAVIWLVALTNLINIIDGIDGLAGGISLMLMILLINVGGAGDKMFPVLLAIIASGALLGFLYFNFPPAKIYMGDGGAYFLGFLIGVLTLSCSQKGTVAAALLAPAFALGLPILDISLAIIRRALKGLPVFRPDRKHLHHRLIDFGFSHRRSVITLYILSAFFLIMALGVFWTQGQLVPIFSGILFLAVIFLVHSFGMVPEKYSIRSFWGELSAIRKETRYIMTLGQWLELEAERCASPEELWDNFQFLARKLNLLEVRLALVNGELAWKNPNIQRAPESTVSRHVPIHSDTVRGLDIVAEESENPKRVFELKSELVAEAWVKAANRWRKHTKKQIKFDLSSIAEPDLEVSALIP